MNPSEIAQIASRWSNEVGRHITECPPNARVVTGDYELDKRIYFFEKESGILVHFADAGRTNLIVGHDVVDEQKFAWFVLRWS